MAVSEKNIETLWAEYFLTGDSELKKNLLMKYIWLVKYTLQGMNLPNHSILNSEDFINIGIIGLNESIERFDSEKGVKFETYALTRIKGTILDELRKLDWLSRTARRKAQQLQNAEDEIKNSNYGEVSPEQIMAKLNVSEDEYKEYLKAAAAAKANQYLNETSQAKGSEDEYDILEEIPDDSQINFLEKIENEERIDNISKILSAMTEKKRLVMNLYYYEELNFRDIGVILHLTESRVCQIHTQVLKEIKQKLDDLENA